MEVYERIKARRKELGLSADDVAAALGVSRATVYRYECADIEKLPTQIIAPLSKVLRCSPAFLMGWTDDPAAQIERDNAFNLSPLEKQIILRFRALPDGEKNMLLRSLGLEEKGEKTVGASVSSTG